MAKNGSKYLELFGIPTVYSHTIPCTEAPSECKITAREDKTTKVEQNYERRTENGRNIADNGQSNP